MGFTTIIVQKGLHPGNYDLVPEIRKTIDRRAGWQQLGIMLMAEENRDLEMYIYSSVPSYLDQGAYCFLDTLKDINDFSDKKYTVNFRNYILNGEKQDSFGDIFFLDDVKGAYIVVDVTRDASQEQRELKYKYTVYRNGNKRELTTANKEER